MEMNKLKLILHNIIYEILREWYLNTAYTDYVKKDNPLIWFLTVKYLDEGEFAGSYSEFWLLYKALNLYPNTIH